MTAIAESENVGTCPRIAHPLDQDSQGINRPPLDKNPMYHEIRENGFGVCPISRANGTPGILVTRYDDVTAVLRDSKVFSRIGALPVDDVAGLEGTLLGLDGEDHTQVRAVIKDWFTPRAAEKRRGDIEARAAAQLQVMIAQGDSADLIEAFSMPFSLDVICDMLGLPQEDRLRFRQWGEAFLGTGVLTRQAAEASELAMAGYLIDLIERRRQDPQADLLSQIAVGGAHLPFDRLIKLPIALVVGGWETAASSIGTFVQVLLTRPYAEYETAYGYLSAHPEMVADAVTEMERMFSTSAADVMPRRVMQDATLPSGARLQEGDVVIPSIDAAGYDPRVFSEPHRMDFARTPNPHLSFGYGPHHCIGRYLGHTEVATAIGLLVRNLPGLRLAVPAEDVPRKVGHAVSGPVRLPVKWS
ncbi:cytochrome P450 [Streptosporangium subroseum]|uniref:cytochrome P450 n=1 Tax=Streptosporangium subroseum TaxID=106412 RepID=UPI0030896CF2|nr:cytochrome P450 [Streptosporangium subroseum]